MSLSRRQVLTMAGATLGAAGCWSATGAIPAFSSEPGPLWFDSIFTDRESASILGRQYLAEQYGRPDSLLLLPKTCGDRFLDECGVTPELSDTEFRQLMLELVQQDYRELRTVTIGGWLFSQTEALMFVLMASQ